MEGVGTALGYGIDHAARRAPIFCRIIGRVDLELADRGLADHVTEPGSPSLFGEKRLVVVPTIDGAIVQKAGDSAETDEPKVAIWGCARCQKGEI